jgi:hypothetical protein
MGNEQAARLKPHVYGLQFKSPFNTAELKHLAKRFAKASHGNLEMTPAQFRDYAKIDSSRGAFGACVHACAADTGAECAGGTSHAT